MVCLEFEPGAAGWKANLKSGNVNCLAVKSVARFGRDTYAKFFLGIVTKIDWKNA